VPITPPQLVMPIAEIDRDALNQLDRGHELRERARRVLVDLSLPTKRPKARSLVRSGHFVGTITISGGVARPACVRALL
jgi:hypothetical protein